MCSVLLPARHYQPARQALELQEKGYVPGGINCHVMRRGPTIERMADNQTQGCREAIEEHRLKQNDLAQQTRSADAAEAMVELADNQSRTLAVGTVLGFLTLVAASLAAKFARDAALEARNGVKDARAQTRAYLDCGPVQVTVRRSGQHDSWDGAIAESLRLNVHLKNIGNTRATDLHLEVALSWGRPVELNLAGDHPALLETDAKHSWQFTGVPPAHTVEAINSGDAPLMRLEVTIHGRSIYGEPLTRHIVYESPVPRFGYFAGEGDRAAPVWNYETTVSLARELEA